jgi:hypothetical protein
MSTLIPPTPESKECTWTPGRHALAKYQATNELTLPVPEQACSPAPKCLHVGT